MITGISWVVFWMSREGLGRRATISATAMLTVIAYQFVLAGELPRFPYLTIMDSIVLLTLITIGATMVQNIITSTLDEGKRFRVDSVCRYAFPVGYYGLLAITLLTALA